MQECMNDYGGLVWSVARKLLRDQADAEDAVQEIFLDIWKTAGRFDESVASPATFIAMIARRRVIDKIRRISRRLSPDSLDEMAYEAPDHGDRVIEAGVDAREAAVAMQTLRPEQQQVLRLSIIQGYSHQEIADATGMPLGTVKTHARRGLIQVRQALGLSKGGEFKEVTAQ